MITHKFAENISLDEILQAYNSKKTKEDKMEDSEPETAPLGPGEKMFPPQAKNRVGDGQQARGIFRDISPLDNLLRSIETLESSALDTLYLARELKLKARGYFI